MSHPDQELITKAESLLLSYNHATSSKKRAVIREKLKRMAVEMGTAKEIWDAPRRHPEYMFNDFSKKDLVSNSEEFNLSPNQLFLKKWLSPDSDNNGVLLFHGVGVGKTCVQSSQNTARSSMAYVCRELGRRTADATTSYASTKQTTSSGWSIFLYLRPQSMQFLLICEPLWLLVKNGIVEKAMKMYCADKGSCTFLVCQTSYDVQFGHPICRRSYRFSFISIYGRVRPRIAIRRNNEWTDPIPNITTHHLRPAIQPPVFASRLREIASGRRVPWKQRAR